MFAEGDVSFSAPTSVHVLFDCGLPVLPDRAVGGVRRLAVGSASKGCEMLTESALADADADTDAVAEAAVGFVSLSAVGESPLADALERSCCCRDQEEVVMTRMVDSGELGGSRRFSHAALRMRACKIQSPPNDAF